MVKVAVITPVYNGGKFLAQAMEAVQRQTYADLVHVVLDNASTDDTPAVISRYAHGRVPLITKRNATLLKAPENWSEAVRMAPDDAAYFKILCADDAMTPDAIEKLVRAAQSAADIRCVFGVHQSAGVPRPTNIPKEVTVFECSNMLARILGDSAEVPYHHMMYRMDVRDASDDFYSSSVVSFDADAAFRVMARGGRCAFVHDPIFGTLEHEDTLTATWAKKMAANNWEILTRVQKYGPGALSRFGYEQVLRRELHRFYRIVMWRMVSGKSDIARRDLHLLKAQGLAPSPLDLVMSLVSWPAFLYYRKFKWHTAEKAMTTAVRPG